MNFTLKHTEKEIKEYISKKGKNSLSSSEWSEISWFQTLSEEFIREYRKELHWDIISCKQVLSEAFIREFQNDVHWLRNSLCQKTSKKFKYEFHDKIYIKEPIPNTKHKNTKEVL